MVTSNNLLIFFLRPNKRTRINSFLSADNFSSVNSGLFGILHSATFGAIARVWSRSYRVHFVALCRLMSPRHCEGVSPKQSGKSPYVSTSLRGRQPEAIRQVALCLHIIVRAITLSNPIFPYVVFPDCFGLTP